jgi:hypothetical protein
MGTDLLTPQQAAGLVESAQTAAWTNYYTCAPQEFALEFAVEVQRVGPAWLTMMSRVDSWFFNRINGLGLEAPARERTLDDAIAALNSAGCKEYTVQLSPLAKPPELNNWLETRGLHVRSNWAKMIRGAELAASASTDVCIESIGAESADKFRKILVETFEMPPLLLPMMSCQVGKPGWLNYLGYDGDHPVASASVFISGDWAWLGMGSTLALHRGRGAQSAMFARRIEDTRESRNPSYRNMLRAGFKLVYMRPNYVTGTLLT